MLWLALVCAWLLAGATSTAAAQRTDPFLDAGGTVLIATPTLDGRVQGSYMGSVLSTYRQFIVDNAVPGWTVDQVSLAKISNVATARAMLASYFLDNPRFKAVVFVDEDISFPPGAIERLLRSGKDVVGVPCAKKHVSWANVKHAVESGWVQQGESWEPMAYEFALQPLQDGQRDLPNGWFYAHRTPDENGFLQISRLGTAMLMIRRHVIERMMEAYAHEVGYNGGQRPGEPPPVANLFMTYVEEPEGSPPGTRLHVPEDYAFCERWKRLGGTIWVDTKSHITHTGYYDFRGDHWFRKYERVPWVVRMPWADDPTDFGGKIEPDVADSIGQGKQEL
ncbi:unnamed protein product [Pedinophyceae sp. YPF-701]|nr:unnamed protein product [Pedinophyceae sp. YPF-701]